MSVTFVAPRDLGKFERKFAQGLRLETQRQLRVFGMQAVKYLQAKSAEIVDLGQFRMGWRYKAAFSYVDIFNAAAHWIFVERGRRAGAKQPPIAAITPWVIRHFGDVRLAWPIARKIARDGIKKRPVLTDPEVQEHLGDMLVVSMMGVRDRLLRP